MKIQWRFSGDSTISFPRLILRKARTFARLQLGISRPDVQVNFLGQSLVVKEGTIRSWVDEDDAWILECQKRATYMFDIGCNVGYTALLGLIGGTITEIVLIDASPEALSIAAKNLIQNQLSKKARFIWAFVTDNDNEKIPFFTGDANSASSAYIDSFTHSYRGRQILVRSISVDSLVIQYGKEPDFIKVDVEGAEDVVLKGATELASKRKTRFLVEVHHRANKTISSNTRQILNWCDETGYKGWILQKHELLQSIEQISTFRRYHLFLQPNDWDYPDWIATIPAKSGLLV